MAVDFERIEDTTKYVLQNYSDTRNNDGLLVSKVMEHINPSVKGLKFTFVLENLKALKLPSCESITRARRKIQSAYPELGSTRIVKNARTDLEEEYKEYARS